MLRFSVSYGLHHKNTNKSTRNFKEKSQQLDTDYRPSMIKSYIYNRRFFESNVKRSWKIPSGGQLGPGRDEGELKAMLSKKKVSQMGNKELLQVY